jgi:hypothetical protein
LVEGVKGTPRDVDVEPLTDPTKSLFAESRSLLVVLYD